MKALVGEGREEEKDKRGNEDGGEKGKLLETKEDRGRAGRRERDEKEIVETDSNNNKG